MSNLLTRESSLILNPSHTNNQPHFHGLSVFSSTLSFVSLFSLSLSTLSNTQHNNLLHYYIYLFNSPKHASNKQYLKNNLMILTSHTFLHSNSTSTQIFNPNSYYFSFLKIKSLFSLRILHHTTFLIKKISLILYSLIPFIFYITSN
jgi:hypothetical protein